jgi:cobalamin biosynthesis Mg chelatase CobN
MKRRQRPVLPLVSSLSAAVQEFLDSQFQSASDLASARSLSAKLKGDRENNEAELRKLQLRVESRAAEGASVAQHLTASLHDLAVRIEQIRSSPAVFSSAAAPAAAGGGGGGGTGENPSSPISSPHPVVSSPSSNGALVQELSSLASEVARVEQVRDYAQNVLRLEQLVGDLEDAVTAATSLARNRRFTVQRTVVFLSSPSSFSSSFTQGLPLKVSSSLSLLILVHRIDP